MGRHCACSVGLTPHAHDLTPRPPHNSDKLLLTRLTRPPSPILELGFAKTLSGALGPGLKVLVGSPLSSLSVKGTGPDKKNWQIQIYTSIVLISAITGHVATTRYVMPPQANS